MADVDTTFASLAARVQRHGAAVLVTVAETRGSVPRDAGTTMIVTRDAVQGTIGGGHLEFEAIRLARAALAQGGVAFTPWLLRFPLAARLGQCCGGVVTLAFDVVSADSPWLTAAVEAGSCATPFAVVACLGRPGHLVVTPTTTHGTLGEPALDALAADTAMRRLAAGGGDGAELVAAATPCATTLIVRSVAATDFTVLVFGNGHVGRALVQMLAAVPARIRWIDAREADFPSMVAAGVDVMTTDISEAELAHVPRGACVVIVTHDHALDLTLVTEALARDDWTYLGLIGSRSKRQQFERRLAARGFAAERIARIVCPIGRSETPSLRSKEPGTIALAVAAEIVAARDRTRQASATEPPLRSAGGLRR